VSAVPVSNSGSSSQISTQNTRSAELRPMPNQSSPRNVKPANLDAAASPGRNSNQTSLWGIFLGRQKSVQLKGNKTNKGSVRPTAVPASTIQADVQLANMAKENGQAKSAGDVLETELFAVSPIKESRSVIAPVLNSGTARPSSTRLSSVPLAERMRPLVLADFVGQGHLVGSRRPLRSLLESSSVSSMILWGPPGCGKVRVVSSLMYLP